MKTIIALLTLMAGTALAQTTVNLGSISLTEPQVTAMTWHWQNYTNALGTNGTALTKGQWFIAESTNLVMNAITRKTSAYEQTVQAGLLGVWATNAVKRAAILAILEAP